MSCNDSDLPELDLAVELRIELPVAPAEVWSELAELLGDDVELRAEPGGALRASGPDGERIGVVDEVEPEARLVFRWMTVGGDDAPSEVEIELEPTGIGTIVRVRETRLDGAHLERSTLLALERA